MADGQMKMMQARTVGGQAMGAARPLRGAARFAAHAAGQAACVGKVPEHDLVGAAYTVGRDGPERLRDPHHRCPHFLTTMAAARRMSAQGSGVVVVLSSSAARESGPLMGGFSLARAALGCLVRTLAPEVGRHGVRIVALRPNAVPRIPLNLTCGAIVD